MKARSTPALKPTFIEAADNIIKRVFFGLTFPVAAWVRVLRFQFGGRVIQSDGLIQLHTL
jgi:hypothetical protein